MAETSAGTAALVPGIDEAVNARLTAGMEAVDRRLKEVVNHQDPFIAEASGYLAGAGGKRFRPLLTLLCAEAGGGINDQVIEAAVGVELTHLASLYHDDVMDEAQLRRGVPSANVRYDNSTSILVGDLLFGTASQVVAGLGADAVRIQADTFVRLCAGQIADDRGASPAEPGADPIDPYVQILADKTGALIATAARYGAMFSGQPPAHVSLLTEFGESLGVVFQLADDLLDVSSDAAASGKVQGTDLREGKATLPVLLVRASQQPGDEHLKSLLSGPISAEDQLQEALELLNAHSAMQEATDYTLQRAQHASRLLDDLPAGPAAEALRTLVSGVALRYS